VSVNTRSATVGVFAASMALAASSLIAKQYTNRKRGSE
jgi:hypothetical protein